MLHSDTERLKLQVLSQFLQKSVLTAKISFPFHFISIIYRLLELTFGVRSRKGSKPFKAQPINIYIHSNGTSDSQDSTEVSGLFLHELLQPYSKHNAHLHRATQASCCVCSSTYSYHETSFSLFSNPLNVCCLLTVTVL